MSEGANAWSSTVMRSAAVFDPALPARSRPDGASPAASRKRYRIMPWQQFRHAVLQDHLVEDLIGEVAAVRLGRA
jgi:hypothetical protein